MELFHARVFQNFLGDANDDFLLMLDFAHAAGERDHDLGNYLDTLLGYLRGRFENRARLHFGDLGIGDSETAAAMPQHGIKLMQLFDALQ